MAAKTVSPTTSVDRGHQLLQSRAVSSGSPSSSFSQQQHGKVVAVHGAPSHHRRLAAPGGANPYDLGAVVMHQPAASGRAEGSAG